jgi:hypothetical protein
MLGTCRLCRSESELKDSHILPRWVFRRIIRFGPDPQPILVENGTRRSTGRQDTEYLLCGPCEQRIGNWENHVAKIAVQPDGTSPAFQAVTLRTQRQTGVEAEADGSALGTEVALFAASVVWRASVCSRPEVSLGPYADEFRAFILGDSTKLEHARLMVHVIDPRAGQMAAEIAAYPSTASASGCREHQFTVPGLTFTLRVGGAVERRYDDFCFLRTGRVWVIDGLEVARYVWKKFQAATPVGKQRRSHRP